MLYLLAFMGVILLTPSIRRLGFFVGAVDRPDNVRKVVFYISGSYGSSVQAEDPAHFLENPRTTRYEFVDMSLLNHMNLPSHVARRIREEITEESAAR